MRKSTFEATLENAIKAAEYYLQCKSLQSTGIHFGCNPKTIRFRFELLINEEPELYKKVSGLRSNQDTIETDRRKESVTIVPLERKCFDVLGKKVTRGRLIDWYANTQYNQKISVGDLIKMAEGYGIKVIR